MRRRTRRLFAAVAAVAFAGCGDELDRRSLLDAYRVIGIRADAPEVGPDDTVTLHVYDFDPASHDPGADAPRPHYIWAICPFSLGSIAAYDCVDPALEIFVRTEGPKLTLDLARPPGGGPSLRALYALVQAYIEEEVRAKGGDTAVYETAFDLERGIPLYVKLYAGREGAGHVDAVKTVLVRESDQPPNRNPEIRALRVGGLEGVVAAPAGDEVVLEVDVAPSSAERYVDPDTGEETTEELLYSWFTTGGELDPERGVGEMRQARLRLPDEPGPLRIYVAVRDGRGGLAVASHDFEVTPLPE